MSTLQEKINQKKILIVEDNLGIVKPITMLLERANYLVESIIDGSLVIPRMKKALPDLLLLDVSMAGADGRDICAELKKSSHTKHVPIILMSAHNNLKKMAATAGADDYISKPFDISSLLLKLEKHLTGK